MKRKSTSIAAAAVAGSHLLGLNDLPILNDEGTGRNPSGRVCASNESRFQSTFFSEPLTAYCVGWRDPENLDQLVQDLFPEVQVGRRFEFKKATNAEAFLSELEDDHRAIGSAFKQVEFTGTTVNEKTHNKGLTIRVDHDDEVGDDWRERYTQMLLQRLMRNELRRGLALVDAAGTNQAKTWNSSANPDGDVRNALSLSADGAGVRANTVVYGEGAWDKRLDVYEAQDTPFAGRAAGMTVEELQRKLMVDRIAIVKARYQSSASAKSKVLGNLVYEYIALPGVTKDDPTSVKRFVTPTDSGRFRVYVEEHAKFTDLSVEHYSNIVVTASDGVRKLTIS